MLCYKCVCSNCVRNVDSNILFEEYSKVEACFNCDECYLYGQDNPELSINKKFNCEDYVISEAEAQMRRKKIGMINR